MKSFNVIRTHFSPYHGLNFEKDERDTLQKIQGITMYSMDQAPEGPNVLITNTHTKLKNIPTKIIQNTKLILHSNSGYDHFSEEVEIWRDIPLLVGHQIRAQAVAEYTLAALWQGITELPQHLAWNELRQWNRPLIKDQDIWIFGYGHIGSIISSALAAMGAKITIIDPFAKDHSFQHYTKWSEGDLSKARIIIVCCSLNKTSKHLFNDEFFQHAHPELLFINGARGKLVKESALREFLLTHPKAQAYLDVFENEPFDESWHHFPQVWKTSHIAGVFEGLDESIIRFEENALKDFISLNASDFLKKYHNELLQNKWIKGELI